MRHPITLVTYGNIKMIAYVMLLKESFDFNIVGHLMRRISFLKSAFILFKFRMKKPHLVLTRDVDTFFYQ